MHAELTTARCTTVAKSLDPSSPLQSNPEREVALVNK